MKNIKNDFGFYYLGKNNSFLLEEISVKNPHKIYIGDNCIASKNVEMTVNDMSNDILKYNLKFGSNSFINSGSKIEAKNYIEIGNNVSIGPQVYISDMEHHYEDFRVPIKQQGIKDNANKVIIKDGTWIGSGVKIIGNIKIGYGCAIGTNSVVKEDIPDHCVVVGAPAKIIKICDYRTGQWIKVDKSIEGLSIILKNRGNFLGYNYYKLQNMRLKSNKKESNKLNKTQTHKSELLEIFTIKSESILNDLYEIITITYDKNMELAFGKIVILADEIENLFSEIIKSSIVKVIYENYVIEFNECLKLIVKAYESKNNESFIMILESQLIELIKNVKSQLEIVE
jgi:acetyltransferase-like isoleucine patch superfamily enzyme